MSRISFFLLFVVAAAGQTLPQSYVVRPVVGSGRGDGGPATEAVLDGPSGLAEDADGNVYVAEANAGVIRRIRPDGIIERFAGSGVIGDGPEGLPALETDLSSPAHLLMDRDGGLIFADIGTCRIRKVQPDGTIQNLVGTGSCTASAGGFGGGFGGGGNRIRLGPETQVSGIGGMALDSSGRLSFTEQDNSLIRRLDSDGYVRTIAGLGAAGYSGDGGAATSASLRYPAGLAFDNSDNLYVGDGTNCRIRIIFTNENIDSVAGTGTCATSATSFPEGTTKRSLGRIGALAYDSRTDSLTVSFPTTYRVARINLGPSRMVPLLGNGRLGATDTDDPLALTLNESSAILVSARYGVLVAADTSFQVYQVQDGAVRSFAGRWPQLSTYPPALSTALVRPTDVFVAPGNSLLIMDSGAERVLQFQDPDQVCGVAGARYPTGYSQGDNGPALQASLSEPHRLVRGPDNQLYITQGSRIRVIDAQGVIKTLLDHLDEPVGIVFDADGRLIFSEAGSHRIVRYDQGAKTKTVIAGTGTAGFSGDGEAATSALLDSPGDLAFDSNGNLLVADRGNRRVRRILSDGTIQTVVGSARGPSYIDITGELATDVGFGRINGMTLDQFDNIYIAEPLRISVVSTDNYLRILTGLLAEADDGTRSYLNGPISGTDGLAVDADGRVYFSLPQDGWVMVAEPSAAPKTDTSPAPMRARQR